MELIASRGKDGAVSLQDILSKFGTSAYGNHSKLSLAPWDLVEDAENGKHRRLTARGRKFVEGRLKIPEEIELSSANVWEPLQGAGMIQISDVPNTAPKRRSNKAGAGSSAKKPPKKASK
jgi:hypothetical protein